jgi:hypothetical protein
MSDIKRYDLNPYDGEVGMEEAADGEYVKFEDHTAVVAENCQNALRDAAIAMCQLCAGTNKFVETDPLQYIVHPGDPCRWFHRFSDTKEIATDCRAWQIHDLIAKVK